MSSFGDYMKAKAEKEDDFFLEQEIERRIATSISLSSTFWTMTILS